MDQSRLAATKVTHYQRMMSDERRVRRYERAIGAVVRPGDVVADVGSGPGILSLLAWRAGAAKVYAIEHDPTVVWVARRLVEANGAERVIEVIQGDARQVALDQRVDVIVSETLGNFGIDENTCESVPAFAERNLKPGGRLIPESLDMLLVPVEYRNEFRGVWRRRKGGVDLRAALDFPSVPKAQSYFLRRRQKELAEPLLVKHFDMDTWQAASVKTKAEIAEREKKTFRRLDEAHKLKKRYKTALASMKTGVAAA